MTSEQKPQLPEWVGGPLWEYAHHLAQRSRTLWLAETGISMVQRMGGLAKALEEMPEHYHFGGPDATDKFTRTKEHARLAQEEVENGFPMLHSQAVVSLWGSLEGFVRTFVAKWLANEPNARKAEAVQKLRIRFGEYEAMDAEERWYHIMELLEQEGGSSLRQGVTRFESLFEVFGLRGIVEQDTRRNLFELQQVRNVVVHRGGIADKRFVDSCPWLSIRLGERVKVSHSDIVRYEEACASYVGGLVPRLQEYFKTLGA